MSKKSKTRHAAKRKAEKKKQKEAKRLLYLRYANEGRSQGSRRARKKRRFGGGGPKPPHERCGNVGCLRCNPETYNLTPGRRRRVEAGKLTFEQALSETAQARGWDRGGGRPGGRTAPAETSGVASEGEGGQA